MDSEEPKDLHIFYPNMRFDIHTCIQVSKLWETDVKIFATANFDEDFEYGRQDVEPIGAPFNINKVEKVFKNELFEIAGTVGDITFEENDDHSLMRFNFELDKKFEIIYIYDIFEKLPDIVCDIDVFIHTEDPIDLEDPILEDLCWNSQVFALKGVAKKYWPEAKEIYQPVDSFDEESDDLYFLGHMKDYIG